MKRIALAAATALGLSAMITPMASAETFSECRERLEDDCALFVPRGSASWAHCVETLLQFECQGLSGAAPMKAEDVLGKLNA